jgi:hypothetical protein
MAKGEANRAYRRTIRQVPTGPGGPEGQEMPTRSGSIGGRGQQREAPVGAPGQALASSSRRGVGRRIPAGINDDASVGVPENRNAKRKGGVKPVNRFDYYADARK